MRGMLSEWETNNYIQTYFLIPYESLCDYWFARGAFVYHVPQWRIQVLTTGVAWTRAKRAKRANKKLRTFTVWGIKNHRSAVVRGWGRRVLLGLPTQASAWCWLLPYTSKLCGTTEPDLALTSSTINPTEKVCRSRITSQVLYWVTIMYQEDWLVHWPSTLSGLKKIVTLKYKEHFFS